MEVLKRILRAVVLFDGKAYAELEEGADYIFQSLIVVIAAAAAFGISLRYEELPGLEDNTGILSFMGTANVAMVLGIATYALAWVVWSAFVYTVGTRLLGGRASFRTLLRAMGIAFAPGVLLILRPIPVAGIAITNITLLWMLVAGTVAVHSSQKYDWVRSTIASGIGWFVSLIFLPLLVIGSLAATPVE